MTARKSPARWVTPLFLIAGIASSVSSAHALDAGFVSAIRSEGEPVASDIDADTWQNFNRTNPGFNTQGVLHALRVASTVDKAKTWLVPKVDSLDTVNRMFLSVRDDRFLEENTTSLAWRFVTDGCSPRASLAAQRVEDLGYRRPSKIFMFGDIGAPSPYHPNGKVSWWYHVAAAIAHQGQVYILDPSVEWSRPLTLKEWISATSKTPDTTRIAVCNTYSHTPHAPCYVSGPAYEKGAKNHHRWVVKWEREARERMERR